MSEASLKRIEAEICADVLTVKTAEDGKALLLRFHTKIARNAAETAFLKCMGFSADRIGEIHQSTLLRLLEAIQSTYMENGLNDIALINAAMKCTGDAFHLRFMELDAQQIRGGA
jgi:hypothetical protein